MKVAIATENNQVAAHFGRCPQYTIATIKDGTVENIDTVANPGHEPGRLPRLLASLGVNCIIAGGMGPRAQELFAAAGIATIVGVSGLVDEVLDSYLQGTLTQGDSMCTHNTPEHEECDHH